MRRLIALLFAGGLLLTAGCATPLLTRPTATGEAVQPAATVERAPDFQLPTLTGETIHLADLQGRYVLINFWATWCLPCRDEMPYLQRLATTHADQITVIGVNMREPAGAVQSFVDEMGVTFPILLQPDDETLIDYGVRGLPLSFVVAPSGELLLRQTGPLQPDNFDRWLDAHLLY